MFSAVPKVSTKKSDALSLIDKRAYRHDFIDTCTTLKHESIHKAGEAILDAVKPFVSAPLIASFLAPSFIPVRPQRH
jgi:hypothetical protein